MLPQTDDNIVEILSWIVSSGKIRQGNDILFKEENVRIALIEAPETGDIRGAALLVEAEELESMQLWSGYPILQGQDNELVITRTHRWSNQVEGVVAACLGEDGPPITFFAPFYYRDFAKFIPGSRLTVSLGALALKLAKAENVTFNVEMEGSPSEFSLAGARILLPSDYVCEWSFRCPVLEVGYVEFMGQPFVKIITKLCGVGDETIECALYAAEHVLQGYAPEAGDDIEGVLWMSGALA